jgi:hypothetical protein
LECILNQVDPQFDNAQGLQYRLSILLSQDGFSFLITDAETQQALKLTSFKTLHADFQHNDAVGWPDNGDRYFDHLKSTGFSLQNWQRVDIAIATHKITLAPASFFTPDNQAEIMAVVHQVQPDEEIITEPVFDLGPVIAMASPRYLTEKCKILFPGAVMHCATSVFVKGLLREHSKIISRQIFINVHHTYFEIVVIQGLRLIYLNSFRYTAASDVLYYVIFVLEQLGFSPSEEHLTVMGEISENDTIFTQLKMYCGSLKTATRPDILQFSQSYDGLSLHQYYTLLNIALCE